MSRFLVTREIGIDMGHRVPTHMSKCNNIHGHRYRILVTCATISHLHLSGEQKDMVVDFGFLKEVMMSEIDAKCDHGMMLWIDDPWLPKFLEENYSIQSIRQQLDLPGAREVCIRGVKDVQTKLVIVPFIPTAERIAQWIFQSLERHVESISKGMAHLHKVEIFETPNCSAVFPGA
jgi:6-pyruvoyltetrahydropterin/6-carboxytetrahydropterin synthase